VAKIFWALLLACVAALSAAAFGVGVATGGIDGPAHGSDLIRLSERPVLYCFQAVLYLAIAVCAGGAAYRLFRQFKRVGRGS
jgi:hypothetical protein